MSERLRSTNTYNKEEIIDDLTKDLNCTLEMGDNKSQKEPAVELETNDNNKTTKEENVKESEIPNRVYDTDNEESEDEISDTEIDEVALKDAEISLTAEQKIERQTKAEKLKTEGNEAFKFKNFDLCLQKYTEGLRICPLTDNQLRSVLYCNRAAVRMKLENYKKAVSDCSKAVELNDTYVKAYIRRAQSLEATEKYDEALADFKKVLELDSSNKDAQAAVVRLPPIIEERNEKLKTEMMGKLKDLGNMILKPFGLSTSNFQLEQDPESKGYKINFKQ